MIAIENKEVTLSCDALRRGRHFLHHQVYWISYPRSSSFVHGYHRSMPARMKHRWSNEFDPTGLLE